MTVFPQGTLIWQRFTNVSCLRTYYGKKRRDSFHPQRVTLLGEDSIFMANLLEIPRLIVFFSYYMIDLPRLFQKRSLGWYGMVTLFKHVISIRYTFTLKNRKTNFLTNLKLR